MSNWDSRKEKGENGAFSGDFVAAKRSTRLFAPFRNVEHQQEMFDSLLKKMPDAIKFDLVVYIGQLESTREEGFYDDQEGR